MYGFNRKLTDYEVAALAGKFNLADGHARFSLISKKSSLQQMFTDSLLLAQQQAEAERAFQQEFFSLSHQSTALTAERILFCPSASLAIEIVANYLRMQSFSVALIEPVFDNLSDILLRHDLSLFALKEKDYLQGGLDEWFGGTLADALFVVMPNNPTGLVFSREDFMRLVEYCARTNKLLIIDASFRFFSGEMSSWDQYETLERSKVSYIVIEDTGKTWPTFELKVSPLLTSTALFADIRAIYRDIFMCHSPVVLSLLSLLIRAERVGDLVQTPAAIVADNRKALREVLNNTPLQPMSKSNVSVEWVALPDSANGSDLESELRRAGIYILPGERFFWSGQSAGAHFVRIALARDAQLFSVALERLREVLEI